MAPVFARGGSAAWHVGTTADRDDLSIATGLLRTVRLDNPGNRPGPSPNTPDEIHRRKHHPEQDRISGLINLPIENKQVKVTPLLFGRRWWRYLLPGTRGVSRRDHTGLCRASKNLLVEAGHQRSPPAGPRMAIRSCSATAHADAARNRRGLEERRVHPTSGMAIVPEVLGRHPQVPNFTRAAVAGRRLSRTARSDRTSQQAETSRRSKSSANALLTHWRTVAAAEPKGG